MSEKGFIKLSRCFFNNPLWMEKRAYSRAEAWIDLLQLARFDTKPEKIITKNNFIILNRGELRASQRYLSSRWNWSLGKVNRFLNVLEMERMVERRMEHLETVINLVKYNDYNPIEKIKMNTKGNQTGTATEQQQVQTKEGEERQERKEIDLPPTAIKTFKEFSKEDFFVEVKKFVVEFTKDTCNEFFRYWTEPDAKGKMKFQLEKTWSTKSRLTTWKNNEGKFGSTQNAKSQTKLTIY